MINCTIISSTETLVYKNVRSILLPAYLGQLQILPRHAESFILLQKGDIILRLGKDQTKAVRVMDGECYVNDDKVVVIL